MKKENADKLVEALRSGKYEQGREYLKQGDKFCCLGVYCDIMGLKWEDTSVFGYTVGQADGSYTRILPFSLANGGDHFRDQCGAIDETLPPLIDGVYGELRSLALMNDKGYTFAQIADVIEQRWEDL